MEHNKLKEAAQKFTESLELQAVEQFNMMVNHVNKFNKEIFSKIDDGSLVLKFKKDDSLTKRTQDFINNYISINLHDIYESVDIEFNQGSRYDDMRGTINISVSIHADFMGQHKTRYVENKFIICRQPYEHKTVEQIREMRDREKEIKDQIDKLKYELAFLENSFEPFKNVYSQRSR